MEGKPTKPRISRWVLEPLLIPMMLFVTIACAAMIYVLVAGTMTSETSDLCGLVLAGLLVTLAAVLLPIFVLRKRRA